MPSEPVGNPYRRVHRIQAKRKGFSWSDWVIVLAAVVAAPLSEPALLHFTKGSVTSQGLPGLVFRMQALIAALMALQTYSVLIRGPDRPVLDPHPVWPKALLKAVAFRGLIQTFAWPLSIWLLAWPLCLHEQHLVFFWLSLPIFSTWLGMKGLGYFMGLAAVWASRSDSIAPLLDMLRGQNPREQAAFIYAPGAALFLIGLTLIASANSFEDAMTGELLSVIFVISPLALGFAGWFLALVLAPLQYVPASAVLAEIDARWAALEAQETGEHVYLDWLAGTDPYRLRAFRQGWRAHRAWPMGAGLLGFLGLISAWAQDYRSAVMIAALGVVAVSAIPFRMAKGDPEWLDLALGVESSSVSYARGWTSLCYAMGSALPAGIMVAIKGGGWQSLVSLIVLGLCVSVISALLAKRFRAQGLFAYAPIALLLWALIGRM